jgi:hypothetical protein
MKRRVLGASPALTPGARFLGEWSKSGWCSIGKVDLHGVDGHGFSDGEGDGGCEQHRVKDRFTDECDGIGSVFGD